LTCTKRGLKKKKKKKKRAGVEPKDQQATGHRETDPKKKKKNEDKINLSGRSKHGKGGPGNQRAKIFEGEEK